MPNVGIVEKISSAFAGCDDEAPTRIGSTRRVIKEAGFRDVFSSEEPVDACDDVDEDPDEGVEAVMTMSIGAVEELD